MTRYKYEDFSEDVRAGMPKAAWEEFTSGGETSGIVPNIRDSKGGIDLFSKLMEERVLRLDGQVDDGMAAVFCSALFLLEKENPEKEITVMINSPGGSVTAGLGMYDAMRNCQAPIRTVVCGMAASMGSILLCAGDENRRAATPNSRVMIHQPSGGGQGTATDTHTGQKLIDQMWDDLTDIYVAHSGTPHEVWDKLLQSAEQRGVWLSPSDSEALGLVDKTIRANKKTPYDPQKIKEEFNYGGRKHFTESIGDILKVADDHRQKRASSNDDQPDSAKKNGTKKPGNGA
jgi:ATP-dependent Clp protease protease subunit